jgi:hypothetical protein
MSFKSHGIILGSFKELPLGSFRPSVGGYLLSSLFLVASLLLWR